VRSPGSDRRDRLESHTNIRWVAVPCWPVFRRDCPNFFVTIASACRPGAKGIGGGSGIASSSPGPSAPPSDAEATTSPSNRRGAVSSDSRIVPAAAREGTVGLTSSPRASDSPREIRFTNNDNGSAGARVAAPGRDALPPASRRATIVPRAELRASDRLPFPSAGTRSRFLRTGREEDKRADDALTGRRLHRGSRVFLVIRCSTTPARAAALPAVTRASSLPA
jgi:hypothetical protein